MAIMIVIKFINYNNNILETKIAIILISGIYLIFLNFNNYYNNVLQIPELIKMRIYLIAKRVVRKVITWEQQRD